MKPKLLSAKQLIHTLQLLPHPEGGYYREIYRSKDRIKGSSKSFPTGRNYCTSIYFLLQNGDASKFHRIKSDELWFYQAGGALIIIELFKDGTVRKTALGPNLNKGQVLQHVVLKNTWFGAYRENDHKKYSLVSCTVSPGFDFRDFEMADRKELLKRYPRVESTIAKLT